MPRQFCVQAFAILHPGLRGWSRNFTAWEFFGNTGMSKVADRQISFLEQIDKMSDTTENLFHSPSSRTLHPSI